MPAGNRHLPAVETRRLPLHMYSVSRETSPQRVSRLLEADGSLLFIAQIQHERHNAGNGAQRSKDAKSPPGLDEWTWGDYNRCSMLGWYGLTEKSPENWGATD